MTDLVERLARPAHTSADGAAAIEGADVLNEVLRRVLDDGTAWMAGSRWRGRAVLRISVSNWSTTDDDVERGLAALRAAAASG